MKIDQVQLGGHYEARVPGMHPRSSKKEWTEVIVVGVGDSPEHGDSQRCAVIWQAPLSPRGRGIMLVDPAGLRLCRFRAKR